MAFVTTYTQSQPAPREILKGVASPLDLRIEVDGVATDATSLSAFVYDGDTLLETLSPTSSGGAVTVTVSAGTTSPDTVPLMSWLTVAWRYTAGARVHHYKERVLVVDQILNAAAPYAWITQEVYQTADADNLPDGQTSWNEQSELAYFELLQRLKMQGLQRHPSLLADPGVYIPMIHHRMRMARIYRNLASRFNQSVFYFTLAKDASDEADKFFSEMRTAYRSAANPSEWPAGGDVTRSETGRKALRFTRPDAYGSGRA